MFNLFTDTQIDGPNHVDLALPNGVTVDVKSTGNLAGTFRCRYTSRLTTPLRLRKRRVRCRITTTGSRPSAVSRNGGDDELPRLRQHRYCKESGSPKSDEDSEAFGVRLLFSGLAFLDVPDENGANYGYKSKCREDD